MENLQKNPWKFKIGNQDYVPDLMLEKSNTDLWWYQIIQLFFQEKTDVIKLYLNYKVKITHLIFEKQH